MRLRIMRGLAALGALVALLAGVPVALWMLSRTFLPDHLPGLDDVTAALLRPDDGRLLLGLLVVVGWVVWAILAASIVAEAADQVRPRRWRRHAAVLRPARALAAVLIGWVITGFAAGPASAAPAVPASHLVAAAPLDIPADTPADTSAGTGRVHVVAARESLWDIAASELGDPLRWREILDLNRDRRQPGGGRLTDDAVLQVGWTLTLPADSVPVHTGDTLTALADRYLGDPTRYDDLYRANVGLPQPDGRTLTDPDLIRPGWLLRLPDQPVDPPPVPPAPTAPTPTSPAPAGPAHTGPAPTSAASTLPELPPAPTSTALAPHEPAPSAPAAAGIPATSPTEPGEVPPASAGVPPSPATPSPVSRAPGTAGVPIPQPAPATVPGEPRPGPVPPAGVTGEWPLPAAPALGVTSVLATGLLAGLLALRRRQQRWRRHGRRIALPDAAHSRLEAAVAAAAQPAGPLFLDLVLRSLTTLTPGHYPAVHAARLTPSGVDLLLAEPQDPPAPFTAADDRTWHVPADASLPLTEAAAVGVANPFPALAGFGTTDDGTTVLLDLEQHGAVHLTGDPHSAMDLLRHLAVELATSRSADGTTVLTVGLDPALTGLPGDRVHTMRDLPSALALLRTAITATRDGLHRLDDATLPDLRVRDQLTDAWLVTVLLVAPGVVDGVAELGELCSDLTRDGRCAAAVVTAGLREPPDGLTVEIGPDGTAEIAGQDRVRVEQMTATVADGVLAILGAATAPDEPVAPEPRPDPWAEGMNEDGTPQEPPHAEGQPPAQGPPAEPASPAVPDPWRSPAAVPATVHPVNPAAHRRMLLAERQDPALDDDLALWNTTTTPPRPLIALLGPPGLRAPGVAPEKRHSWYLEVVLYLALHPHGVDRDKLMTDLWPDGSTIQPPTIRRAIAEARAWAGKDTTTDPPTDFVPAISPAGGDRYRITGHLTDWDLFRRLRKRGHARAAAGQTTAAITDYTAALRLVRGPVLHPLRARGYAWLHNPDQRHPDLVPGFVIDTAHDLVDLALDAADLDLARFAATTAQTVDPDRTSDRPFTDLMRIAHAAGDLDEMRTHAELLLAERDFEVGEELPPESFAVFNQLFPHGLRARAS